MCSVCQGWAKLSHPHRFGCWTGGGSAPLPYSQQGPQAQCPFCIPLFPAGQLCRICSLLRRRWNPSPHRDPQPGQQQSLAASNGNNCSLARAIPVESLAALVLPRLFFHAIISCLSDPLPAQWPPGTAVAHWAGGDSQGMEMGEVPVSALQGQTWACK